MISCDLHAGNGNGANRCPGQSGLLALVETWSPPAQGMVVVLSPRESRAKNRDRVLSQPVRTITLYAH